MNPEQYYECAVFCLHRRLHRIRTFMPPTAPAEGKFSRQASPQPQREALRTLGAAQDADRA